MELYLLRHAVAVERGSPDYPDDSQRPLTKEGRVAMKHYAKALQTLDLQLDYICSSPYKRARETAEIAADVLKPKHKIIFTKNLVPPGSFEDLIAELKKNFKKSHRLMLVGHEPHLSHFASFLLTSGQQISLILKKGGICSLTLPKISGPGGATLNWLLNPQQLRLIPAN
jgi:phosphohistidine phosphatase